VAAWTGAALVLFFVLCTAGFVLSGLLRDRQATLTIGWVGTVCALLLMVAAAARLAGGDDFDAGLWTLPGAGALSLHVDALSAVFLLTAGLVYVSCCLFAPAYLLPYFRNRYPARRYAALHFALMASVAGVLAAGDALTFLLGWEVMSILCYLLVNYEQRARGDSAAGYIMLAMGEAGFLAVVVAFVILAAGIPGLEFSTLRVSGGHLSAAGAWTVFLLGFLGFGVKAGLVPVNAWLPRCYTTSPPAFIPVLAGVTLNLGIYGILRLDGDLVRSPGIGPGMLALIIGSVTALVGILYATTENDLKTMLAHSSIENAGIIVAAIGAFLVFRSSGHAVPAALALTAALYHVVNHSVYKALLYQGAGHVEAVTGTRDMDRLGGLARAFPALSVVFLVGCLAISAVPPFNGFVSEWLVLQTLLRSALLPAAGVRIVFALCGAMLALTAALAVTCFVKTYAMSFLGIRRGSWRLRRTGVARGSRLSLALLAAACVVLGVLPTYVISALDGAVEPLAGTSVTASLVPPFFSATESNGQLPSAFLREFHDLGAQTGAGAVPGRGLVLLLRGSAQNPVVFAMSPSYSLAALALLLLFGWLLAGRLGRRRAVARREVWAGGIPSLLSEMTYTATGFSNPVRVVFEAVFRPNIVEDTRQTVAVHFRTAIRRRRDETHLVERLVLHPVGVAMATVAKLLAGMHHGRLGAYVGYVLGFLIVLLVLYRLS
jgi:hydrogenase-4 component B